jgi:co-chaperonin GroES (HSP10)
MKNSTGIIPIEYKVLIKPDTFEEQTVGGLYFPDDARDRLQMAQDKGTLIAFGGLAFSDWKGKKPEVGQKVIFNKYSGTLIQVREKGDNSGGYRLCNDKDICAIWEE